MPLTSNSHNCGETDCENKTNYYKNVFIPYPETIHVSINRKAKGKLARVYLCPDHYETPLGDYIFSPGSVVFDDGSIEHDYIHF